MSPVPQYADVRPATDPPPLTAAALTFAILSLCTWWLPPLGGALAVVALIMTWIGASSARAHPGRYLATMAPTATRVVAGIGLVLAGMMFALWLLVAVVINAASATVHGMDDADNQRGHHHHHAHEGHEGEDEPQTW